MCLAEVIVDIGRNVSDEIGVRVDRLGDDPDVDPTENLT